MRRVPQLAAEVEKRRIDLTLTRAKIRGEIGV
jgi:hypothetical protein